MIVAPKGSTKLAMDLLAPRFSVQFFIFTGSAAAELQVVKPKSIVSVIPLKNFKGLILPSVETMEEYTTSA